MKTVLVTGASRGIGRAIAEKFLDNGFVVYGTYNTSLEPMKAIEEKYGKNKFKICGPFNFCDLNQTNNLVAELLKVKFDHLILSAGMFSENDDFLNFDLDDFTAVMNCNFYSPLIIATRLQNNINVGGSIVLMSSNDAYSGAYGSMSYSISKSAILSLMKCLSVNFGRRNVRVNSIAPGAIDTDMNTPEQVEESPLWTPMHRIAKPYEVANVVYYLTSAESSFINGENITIDGGYSNVSILLKKEVESGRKFVDYKYMNDEIRALGKGDSVLALDTTPEYGWIDHPDELEFEQVNLDLQKKGGFVKRIIIANDEKLDEVLNNKLVDNYFKNTQKNSLSCIVKYSDVLKHNKKELIKTGKGYYIILKKGKPVSIFIDSFNGDKEVGYVTTNEKILDQMLESFNNLEQSILSKKIKPVIIKK